MLCRLLSASEGLCDTTETRISASKNTDALSGFLTGKTLSGSQIEFSNLVIQHFTEHGVMNADLLYKSPFTAITPSGPEKLFEPGQVDELFAALQKIEASARVA